jgi:hypothetical protein
MLMSESEAGSASHIGLFKGPVCPYCRRDRQRSTSRARILTSRSFDCKFIDAPTARPLNSLRFENRHFGATLITVMWEAERLHSRQHIGSVVNER